MAFVFVTYADERFKISAERITRQARRSGIFDRIAIYSPKELPASVRSSPLFLETKGGGYWCWKPYIISHALKQCEVGDVVVYADAGCTLIADSPEWTEFKRLLQDHTAIFFQYRRDYQYQGWEQYCHDNAPDKTAIKHWMKPSLIDYFQKYNHPGMFDYDSLWAGFIIYKKTERQTTILDQWLKITFLRPDLVIPPFGYETIGLPGSYYDHRCNQSILTPLVFLYKDEDKVAVLPETSESQTGHPAILASRWRQAKLSQIGYLKYRVHEFLFKNR